MLVRFFFGTKDADVLIGKCQFFGYRRYLCYCLKLLFWVQKLLPLYLVQYFLSIVIRKCYFCYENCVIFGTKCFGIVTWNCYFWYKILWYFYFKPLFLVKKSFGDCYLKLIFLVRNSLVLLFETVFGTKYFGVVIWNWYCW